MAAGELAESAREETFRDLVVRHSRMVFRVAFRMTGNEQDAEDVVQETFLRAYRSFGRFDSRASFFHLDLPHRGQLRRRPPPRPQAPARVPAV